MGHAIAAMIGNRRTLAGLIERLGPPEPTEIPFDLVVVPLNDERWDAIATSSEPAFDGFTYLTPETAAGIGRQLGEGPALYIETDYHGGTGRQGAALFDGNALVRRRTESTLGSNERRSWFARRRTPSDRPAKSPISEGLARLGVVASGSEDEFDRVGLGGFRSLAALGLDRPD